MIYALRIRRAAENDIAEAQIWYETQREGLGIDFHVEISQTIDRLAETPFIYAITYRDIRKAVVRRFPYLVWYRVSGIVVTVLACTDGREAPNKMRPRFQ